jgi:predicted double-glycine peptidase
MIKYPRTTALILTVLLAILVIGGCAAGEQMDNLVRRVRTEVTSLMPKPDFVPTPLAAPEMVATLPTFTPTPVPATATAVHEAASPTPQPTPTATATPVHAAPGASASLSGFSHMWQTWNNCGPATLAMNLSYFGSTLDQAAVAATMRPNPDDKNVSPHEMADFARVQGYLARVQVNGTPDLLRTFLANGLPVIVETWHEDEPNNGMGHYRLLTGYDDPAQRWIAFDSFDAKDLIVPDGPYAGIRVPYANFDELWRVFNRVFVIVYTPERAGLVESILGEQMADEAMWAASLAQAETEAQANPADPFAPFNQGSSLLALGRPGEAAAAYDQARRLGLPWRMLWYQFGPFEAYFATGRHAEIVALADATLRNVTDVEELHYWRGLALQAQGDGDAARRAFQKAVELNPHFQPAIDALALP